MATAWLLEGQRSDHVVVQLGVAGTNLVCSLTEEPFVGHVYLQQQNPQRSEKLLQE
jgi:hypothetical protein